MPIELVSEVVPRSSTDLSVEQALEVMAAQLTPPRTSCSVSIDTSLNRILARDVISPLDLPGFDNAAMDGYALRWTDLTPGSQTRLPSGELVRAGDRHQVECAPGQAVRIFTGAPLPRGADTVVTQEQVLVQGSEVVVPAGVVAGQHVRLKGEDLASGTLALAQGRRLSCTDLGLGSALGLSAWPVYHPLRIAVLSTGSELVTPGQTPGFGQIHDSNRPTLLALLQTLGCECHDLGILPDRPEQIRAILAQAGSWADAILCSGGVSVGMADHVKSVLHELGKILFWRVAMRPGRPFVFGQVGQAAFFGLPGNPVAVVVGFQFLVRPVLLRLAGMSSSLEPPRRLPVRCPDLIEHTPGRCSFLRGCLSTDSAGQLTVRCLGAQGSHQLSGLYAANCYIVFPASQTRSEPGGWVDIVLFSELS